MTETPNARLLDCGLCYEEQGEEVHPHPECPIGKVESAARYRHRTTEVEAIQWTGHNAEQLRAFCGTDFDTIDPEDRIEDLDQDAQVLVQASHWAGMGPGDWVLKHPDHFDIESDEAFRAQYEPAGGAPATDQTAPAVWIDGHPQLEAIAAAVWEQCRTEDTSLVVDDPRNIAVAAASALAVPEDPAAAELTAQEARDLADELGIQLYRAEDALAFVEECCVIADREQRPVTTAMVRERLKGARCGRQLAADAIYRDALRELAADALADTDGWKWAPGYDKTQSPTYQHYLRYADAVLFVLPASIDRADVVTAAPVKQRADCTELEWAEQERARFERLYTRETARADLAEQRADTAARDADIYQRRLERLSDGYTKQRKRAEEAEADANHNADLVADAVQRAEQAEAEVERLRTDRGAVLEEAADRYQGFIDNADTGADPRYWTGIRDMAIGLRRMAAESVPADAVGRDDAHEWFVETRMRDGRWSKYGASRDTAEDGRELFDRDTTGSGNAHAFRLIHATTRFAVEAEHDPEPAGGAPQPKETDNPRTVCVCGHTRGEHLRVSGRLLCDECVPDSTTNLVCKEFEAL